MSAPTPLLSLPALPRSGARVDLPALAGSSDALALAELAGRAGGRLLAVVTASAADAQRLLDEIPWFAPGLRVRLLPDWETLPYDHFSPHQDLVSERLATLWAAMRGELDILLVPAATAVCRLAPPAFLAAYTFAFRKGERLDADKFRGQVTLAGYAHVTQVVSPGEYSIRGGLIDLFPMGSPVPYRLDLFDDEIESIKTFDVDSQRTIYPVPDVRLLPAREFPLDDTGRHALPPAFPRGLRGRPGEVGHLQGRLDRHRQRRHRVLPAAVLRAKRRPCSTTCPAAAVLRHPRRRAGRHRRLLEGHPLALQPAAGRQARPLLPPEELFLSDEVFFAAAKGYGRTGDFGQTVTATVLTQKLLPGLLSRSIAAPTTRWAGSRPTSRPSRPRAAAGRISRPARDAGGDARRTRPETAASADFADFAAGDAPAGAGRRAAADRLRPARCNSPSSPKPSCTPARRAAAAARPRARRASTTG